MELSGRGALGLGLDVDEEGDGGDDGEANDASIDGQGEVLVGCRVG